MAAGMRRKGDKTIQGSILALALTAGNRELFDAHLPSIVLFRPNRTRLVHKALARVLQNWLRVTVSIRPNFGISRRTLLSSMIAGSGSTQAQAGEPRIWDLHCHLNGFDGDTPSAKAAEMLRFADRMGVERMCIYMGYPFSYDPVPEDLRAQNNQVLEALRAGRERTLGFVYLNPNYLDFSLREFDRCVRDGPMVGVKLWVAKRAAAKELDAIVARASALKAAVFQHTWFKVGGNLAGESTPNDVAELARRYPSMRNHLRPHRW